MFVTVLLLTGFRNYFLEAENLFKLPALIVVYFTPAAPFHICMMLTTLYIVVQSVSGNGQVSRYS